MIVSEILVLVEKFSKNGMGRIIGGLHITTELRTNELDDYNGFL